MPNKNIAWYKRWDEFINICKTKNVECLDSKEIYIEKTTKYGYKAKIKLKCLKCNNIVETTTINKFINSNALNCKCSGKKHWCEKYIEFIDICKTKNVECLDTEEEYIKKTKKKGKGAFAMLKLKCLTCEEIVETTHIHNFTTRGRLGCKCNTSVPWYKRYPEFCEICKSRNVKCLDTEEEFIKKTQEKRAYAMIKIQCLTCEEVVETTDIHHFISSRRLGCNCANSKSEKLMIKYVNNYFTDNTFIKIRPDWLKYTTGCNLELDYYCEELKLTFEYNGIQHYEYRPYFHNNNIENFYKQQERDKFKEQRCKEEGIYLIVIPHQYNCYNEEKLYKYIDEKIEEWEIETKQDKILEKGKIPQKKYRQKIINDSETRRQKQNKYKSEWNTKPKFCDVCNLWTTNNSWCHHKKTKLHQNNLLCN